MIKFTLEWYKPTELTPQSGDTLLFVTKDGRLKYGRCGISNTNESYHFISHNCYLSYMDVVAWCHSPPLPLTFKL